MSSLVQKLVKDLAKNKCPITCRIIPSGKSAAPVEPWIPQFFEEQLRDRYQQCLNKVLCFNNKLKRKRYYARKLKIRKVLQDEKKEFLNNYHIQGDGQGEGFGLYDNQELVAICVVKVAPSNTKNRGMLELNRYATKGLVVGGMDRLMKSIAKFYNINTFVSYADLMHSNGDMYVKDGWKEINRSKPDYKYLYKGHLKHKFNFRIKNFRDSSELKFRPGLTEAQLASINKLVKVFDLGKITYLKTI